MCARIWHYIYLQIVGKIFCEIVFKIPIRGHPHITSPPWGGGGVCKMMTYDDRGEGGLQNDDVINKGSFLEQYPKKITQ